jgi:hypothetical protein
MPKPDSGGILRETLEKLESYVKSQDSVIKSQEERLRALEGQPRKHIRRASSPSPSIDDDLSEPERKVMSYILYHPDVSKQDVVDHFKGEMARVSVFYTVDSLVRYGIVQDNLDPKNRQTHRLVVDKTSTFFTVLLELTLFGKSFQRLLDKIKQKTDELEVPSPNRLPDEYFELTILAYRLFENMVQSYITRYIGIWPKEFSNKKEVLNKLILMVFSRIAGWKEQLPKINVEGTDYYGDQFMIFRLRGTEYLRSFYDESKRLGLAQEMESVLDALWAINTDVQMYAYPEPRLFFWEGFEYHKDDWRKLLEVAKKHPEESLFNMKEMPIDGLLNKPLEITKTTKKFA